MLRYVVNGKRKQEALGWASQGWTVSKAQAELVRLKEAARTGKGPITLADKRKEAETERQAEAERQARLAAEGLTFGEYWEQFYFPQAKQDKTPRSWKREDQFFSPMAWPRPCRPALERY